MAVSDGELNVSPSATVESGQASSPGARPQHVQRRAVVGVALRDAVTKCVRDHALAREVLAARADELRQGVAPQPLTRDERAAAKARTAARITACGVTALDRRDPAPPRGTTLASTERSLRFGRHSWGSGLVPASALSAGVSAWVFATFRPWFPPRTGRKATDRAHRSRPKPQSRLGGSAPKRSAQAVISRPKRLRTHPASGPPVSRSARLLSIAIRSSGSSQIANTLLPTASLRSARIRSQSGRPADGCESSPGCVPGPRRSATPSVQRSCHARFSLANRAMISTTCHQVVAGCNHHRREPVGSASNP